MSVMCFGERVDKLSNFVNSPWLKNTKFVNQNVLRIGAKLKYTSFSLYIEVKLKGFIQSIFRQKFYFLVTLYMP